MAKRLSSRTNEKPETLDTVTPPVFDPNRFYTDAELAEAFRCHPKTVKRQRAKDPASAVVEFSKRTIRTPGFEANRMWQSRLKNSAA
jgi:hypothetical protein